MDREYLDFLWIKGSDLTLANELVKGSTRGKWSCARVGGRDEVAAIEAAGYLPLAESGFE